MCGIYKQQGVIPRASNLRGSPSRAMKNED
jgi:hypothetical protein